MGCEEGDHTRENTDMKLTGFQVQMYKCVLDSKWINVSPLTVLVGKNESGKTTLLRALQKFNPFKPEPYAVRDEWPRAKRDQRTPTQIACTAEFELTPEEVSHLAALTDQGTDLSRLRISKDYAGTFEVHFPEGLFPERLHPNDIDTMCSTLPSLTEPVHDNFRKEAASCREAIIRLAREVRYSDLAGMGESIATTLNAARSQPHQGPQLQNENTFVTHLTVSLKAISKSLSETPSIHKKAHDYVISRLPTFVYMDEYRAFRGTIHVNESGKS